MKKNIRQFMIYLVVGGLATLVEWGLFWLLNKPLSMDYRIATTIAYALSTLANWFFGKVLLFKEKQNIWKELGSIYLTSLIGWGMNLLIMWIAVQKLALPEMLSKMGATAIVFFWNFLVRKLLIYRV